MATVLNKVVFEFDSTRSPNVVIDHQREKALKIEFKLALCNVTMGDMLAIFEAGGNLTNPRAIAMVDAEPGTEVLTVTFHPTQLESLHGKFNIHYIRNFPERVSLGSTSTYFFRCPTREDIMAKFKGLSNPQCVANEMNPLIEAMITEQDDLYFGWRENLKKSTERMGQAIYLSLCKKVKDEMSSKVALLEFEGAYKTSKIAELEAQVADFRQKELDRKMAEAWQPMGTLICNPDSELLSSITGLKSSKYEDRYDRDEFNRNGIDSPFTEDLITWTDRPKPGPISRPKPVPISAPMQKSRATKVPAGFTCLVGDDLEADVWRCDSPTINTNFKQDSWCRYDANNKFNYNANSKVNYGANSGFNDNANGGFNGDAYHVINVFPSYAPRINVDASGGDSSKGDTKNYRVEDNYNQDNKDDVVIGHSSSFEPEETLSCDEYQTEFDDEDYDEDDDDEEDYDEDGEEDDDDVDEEDYDDDGDDDNEAEFFSKDNDKSQRELKHIGDALDLRASKGKTGSIVRKTKPFIKVLPEAIAIRIESSSDESGALGGFSDLSGSKDKSSSDESRGLEDFSDLSGSEEKVISRGAEDIGDESKREDAARRVETTGKASGQNGSRSESTSTGSDEISFEMVSESSSYKYKDLRDLEQVCWNFVKNNPFLVGTNSDS